MSALRARLLLTLLGVVAFILALVVEPESRRWQAGREGGLLPLLFGDGRRLFANHFFAKADAYFHKGVYPSIFDRPLQEEMHMVAAGQSSTEEVSEPETGPEARHEEEEHAGHDAETCDDPTHQHDTASAPRGDWVAWVNRRVRPTEHAHLGGGEEREMLPWLLMAAELDPGNVQNFTITAYWLRRTLGRVDEAEQFLREGLRHNPGDPRILFELGVLLLDNRQELDHAHNVFQLAWDRWELSERPKAEPDYLLGEGILARLALVDETQGRLPQAVEWLRKLEPISPNPEEISRHIRDLEERMNAPAEK